jgi:hypothetical protein
LTDYQEFAPLPGGNLGTSAQSYILHMKSKGKGPALFQKVMSHFLNFRVLPDNVEFRFDEPDPDAEKEQVEIAKLRAEERAVRIQSQEITPAVARQMAKDSGDLAPEVFDAMGGLDMTPNVTVEDVEKPQTPAQQGQPQQQVPQEEKILAALKELGASDVLVEGADASMVAEAWREAVEEIRRAGPEEIEEERLDVEEMIKQRALVALKKMRARIVERMRLEQKV